MTNELTDEQLRDTEGYKLGWMEGMQEGAERAIEAHTPDAYVNGDEFENMLDDRTATIQSEPSGWRSTPLYRHPVAAQASQLVVPRKDDWAEVVGEVSDLYARLLTEKQAVHALRGIDRGTQYYMADAIRWSVAELQRRAQLERKEPQANQMIRIFPDEVISAASEVAWCICLPDGRVELSNIFTDFDEATEYLRERAIAGCSLRGLKFASTAKDSK